MPFSSVLQEDQTAAELALSRAQLFPLKKENARLLRDNNLLHLKVSCAPLPTVHLVYFNAKHPPRVGPIVSLSLSRSFSASACLSAHAPTPPTLPTRRPIKPSNLGRSSPGTEFFRSS